ncbi:MAG: 3-dehydroquinate synthase [Oscillospiraceae bacterium]|nr:3-dehydroquinate synthase [Oscillospiraceae bacterium]
MRKVAVITPSKAYEVFIDRGILAKSGEVISEVCGVSDGNKVMLVSDNVVDGLYGDTVIKSLESVGFSVSRFTFANGEQSKTMATYSALLDKLAEENLTRSDLIVALGGGVVGDLAGFAAATYLRGVRLIQVPTTLLSMVDSAVGGKTGVNLSSGKNQVGAFYQPSLVLCDVSTLATLPEINYADGVAEIIKHAVIRNSRLFEILESPPITDMSEVIARNVEIKRDIVVLDERDTGIRQLLNFGHTIGHGIEKFSGYTVTHGHAVAIGMSIVSRGAFRTGLCDESCYSRIVEMLQRYGLPTDTDIPAEKLIKAAFSDKKRVGDSITLVLPERIGKCSLRGFSMNGLADFVRLSISS